MHSVIPDAAFRGHHGGRCYLPAWLCASACRSTTPRTVHAMPYCARLRLVVTLSAIVLGFLVGSAKSYYGCRRGPADRDRVPTWPMLDRLLTGTERRPSRPACYCGSRSAWRSAHLVRPQVIAAKDRGRESGLQISERLDDAIVALPDGDPHQTSLREQALVPSGRHAALRPQALSDRAGPSTDADAGGRPLVARDHLPSVSAWSRRQPARRRASMMLAAFASAGALFLIVELYSPVSGLLQIQPAILEDALPPLR